MKLQELIDVKNGEKQISQMSFYEQEIKNHLFDWTLQLNRYRHLVKIFYFKDHADHDKWIEEILFFIPYSPFVKGKNRRLSKEEIFHLLWKGNVEEDPLKEYRYYLESSKDEYEDLDWCSIKENIVSILSFIEDFHLWVAEKLSSNGEIYVRELYETIKNLLKKY